MPIRKKYNSEFRNRHYLKLCLPFFYSCDVTDREAVLKLADQIKREIGPISVLVNNAGIMPTKRFEDQTVDDIRRTFEINVFAHFWTLEAFLPHMKEQNRGHIIATCSMTGMVGMPNLVPYSGSKFAVRGIMEGLRFELREGPYRDLVGQFDGTRS